MEGVGRGFGFGSVETKDEVILLEGRRRQILCEMEVTWKLKSQALWFLFGDGILNYFRLMQKEERLQILSGGCRTHRVKELLIFRG